MIFPKMHQLQNRKNPNYLHSFWLGFSVPVLNFWSIVFFLFVVPLFDAIRTIFMVFIRSIAMGVMGVLDADNITIDESLARQIAAAQASK